MGSTSNLRSRRSEAQLHALAGVEREIRATDPSGRRKYLREFAQAFRSYQSVLSSDEFKSAVNTADVVLVGDYHALPAAQRFAATLFEERALLGTRKVVLGVETIFARDQRIVDEWWRREIDEAELRQRIRFDIDWGYDWAPFYQLLVTAREHADGIYGLDCMPREDLRKIGARDRHAAHKIGEIRQRHPDAVIMALFGESHLAPGHLPRQLRERLPQERALTVLQNIDALYWQAAGEPERVEAVRVADDVLCVFNSTPLEKYESYRLHLSRWGRGDNEGPDLVPTIYNLIDSLIRFLDINRYSSHNGTQPKFLVDLLPEVCCGTPNARLRRLLAREAGLEEDQISLLKQLENRGSAYLPKMNVFYVSEFQMMYAAEEAARFLHRACRGLLGRPSADAADLFYAHTLEHALGYFGSRVLYPARPDTDGDCELSWSVCEEFMETAVGGDRAGLEEGARQLGYIVGRSLYEKYLAGAVSRQRLRQLFLARLEEPGIARAICLGLVGKRSGRKRPKSVRAALSEARRTG